MFGAGVALTTVLATKSWERRRDIDREQRANRIPTYQRVLTAMFNYVHASASDPAGADQEIKKTFAELNSQMIIWASDPVISAYVNWRSSIGTGSPLADMFRLGELLLTIRKDVGHQNKNVNAATVLQVFVNDLNTAIAAEIAKLQTSAANGVTASSAAV
jgi:thiamine biosynthesis lipoprotein ApbE